MDPANQPAPRPKGVLVDYAWLEEQGIFKNRMALHRARNRAQDDNQFPQALRHTHTGLRLWWEGDVKEWREREALRRKARYRVEDLVPDTDPARWSPKARAKTA